MVKKSLIAVLASTVVIVGIYLSSSVTAQDVVMSNTYGYDYNIGLFEKAKPSFIYKVESRFIANVTAEQLHSATSIRDIVPLKATEGIESFTMVRVAQVKEGEDIRILGDNELLNEAQLKLIQSTSYSDDIYVEAFYKVKDAASGILHDKQLVYYLSVIPEKVAVYSEGNEGLINYLKLSSPAKTTNINQEKLQAGRIRFIVTKNGKVENVNLESSSSYKQMDASFVDLIKKMPGTWKPAMNSKGEAVDQELVFFFGTEGC